MPAFTARTTRARLLLSACFLATPQLALAQTTVTGTDNAGKNVSGTGTITVTPTGALVVTGNQAININAPSNATGVVITVQKDGTGTGRIEAVGNTATSGRAISSSVDGFRETRIDNAGVITASNDAIRFAGSTTTAASSGTITINNTGSIVGTSGTGSPAQTSGAQGIEDTALGTTLVVNNTGGSISGSQGILSAADVTTITNSGTITGTGAISTQGEAIRTNLVTGGTVNGSTLTVTNQVGGTISGVFGIIGTGSSNTIDNFGTISGSANSTSSLTREAIRTNAATTLLTNQVNTVTLRAGSTTSAGTGTGASGNAVAFGGTVAAGFTATNTLNIEVGAVINGNIQGGGAGATDTLNLRGTGAQVLVPVSGFEGLNVQGGTWGIVNGFNVTSPATIAAGATLRYDDAGAGGGSVNGAIVNNGTLIDNRTGTVVAGGAISGAGAVQVVNTGTLELAGTNTYSGATTISNGRLRTGQQANSFSAASAVTVAGDGILDLNDSTQDGGGVSTPVARDNTIANLSGNGTVRLGSLTAATLTTGAAGGDTTFSGTFTQLGNLTKVGTGTLTLSGLSSATGLLTVSAGGVSLPGRWAGAATLANGTSLAGAGTVSGVLTVGSASVSPGNAGIGTLTTGGLVLASGSQLNYELGTPGAAGDLIQVNGNLTLDGTVNVADVGGFGVGVYRLINYTGTLTDNGLVVGTIPGGTSPALFSIQTSVAKQVNLIYGAPAPTTLQFWDGADLTGNGTIDGGSGSWTNSLPNWTDANGAGNTAWTGNFAVFQGAAGTVTVDDAISFTGAQFITDGYQVVAGTGGLSAANTLTTIRVDPTVTATISAAIGGTGGLLKEDTGTLVLGGTNSYAGATTVLNGTLRVTGGNAITDTSAVSLSAGTTLDLAASETIGSLSGAGAVTLSGGTLTTGTLDANVAYDGIASGAGGLTKVGTGTLTLNGANSYTGATTVNAGTLALGTAGSLGTGNLTVASGGALALNGRATTVGDLNGGGTIQLGTNGVLTLNGSGFIAGFAGTITGTNATLTRTGAGIQALSGVNDLAVLNVNSGALAGTVTGAIGTAAAVTIAAPGVLSLTANQTAASLAGTGQLILTGATLTQTGAANTTYAGVASGTGGLSQAGTGTLTLTGANTYTGTTGVTGGTLQLDGSVAGAATVATGGTLAGTGSVAGTVTVAEGRLSPGDAGAIGTLTVGGLVLGAASNLDYQLGAATATGDRIQVNGALTLDGTINVTDIGGFGAGVYRVIDYTGALTDNGLLVGTLPNTVTRNRVQVQTAVANQVNLVVGGALPAVQFWDGANTVSNGRIDGGSGSWTNTLTNWTDANGNNNDQWGGQFAVFSGAAGTVTVDDAIQFSGMQFTTNGYVIAAGTGTLEATQAQTNIRTDAGVTATIGASIVGAGGLNKLDTGTLILTGANSYTGTTTVAGGTLRAGGAGALPTGTAVTVANGGTLDIAAAQTIGSLAGAGAVTLTGTTLTTGGDGTATSFTGVISGTGALTKTGAGVFTLGGANTHSGGTSVDAGTLRLATGGSFGSGALTVAAGATADLAGNAATVGGLNGAGAVTLGSATLTVGGPGSFAGVVSGTGGLIKAGTGTLTLTGVNTYTGATTVSGGTLAVGTGTIPTASAVVVNSGGTFQLNGAATIASLNGAGNVALGANTLTLGSGTYTGIASGTGGVTKTGTGTLTLGGANSYTGATAVTGGTLALTGTNAIAASSGVALTGGAQLSIAGGGNQTVNGLTGATGTTVVLGANTLTINNAAANTVSSIVSGTGTLAKTGTGTLILSGANTHSGGTTVSNGTLQAGATNAFGPGVLTVAAPGGANLVTFAQTVSGLAGSGAVALGSATLTVNGAATTAYAGVLSGTGGLTRSGTGSLTLGGANTYTGATNVTGGTLLVNGSTASSVTVGNAGRLGGTGTIAALTANGTVAPGATGAGTLRVAGNATLGATSILEVDATPTGTADQLAVTGTVTLAGGGVQVKAGGAAGFSPLNTYTILTGSTVTGTFGSVTSDAAFLTPSLVYNPASVQLRLVRNDISFASVGVTPNQSATGAAIQTQQSGTLFDRVVVLGAADARTAFDQLSGEIHAVTPLLARREGHAAGRAVLDRLETATGDGIQLWIEGSAGSTTIDGRNGYASIDSSRYGLAGGAEVAGGGTRGGIGFRHSQTDIDLVARNSSADLSLNSAFAYFGHDFGALRFGVTGSIGFLRATTDRSVAFTGFSNRLAAREKGQTFTGAGEIAYLAPFGGFRAGPYAGISYVDTVLDGTTETGGTGALALEKVEDSTGSASYGLRGVGTLGSVTLLADIGGRSYLDDLGRPRTLRFDGFDPMFAVSPAGYAKTTVNARLEAGFDLGPVRLGIGGRAEVGRDTTSYAGRVSAGFRF